MLSFLFRFTPWPASHNQGRDILCMCFARSAKPSILFFADYEDFSSSGRFISHRAVAALLGADSDLSSCVIFSARAFLVGLNGLLGTLFGLRIGGSSSPASSEA
jgi:hypothetical protein